MSAMISHPYCEKCGVPQAAVRCRPCYERAVREAREAALEQAAQECERHAKFCHDEAHKGGDFQHLITRKDEAIYNASRIRALKSSEPAVQVEGAGKEGQSEN